MRDELQVNDEERHSHFHGNDDLISVEELWQSWVQSEGQNIIIDQIAKFTLSSGTILQQTFLYLHL